MSNAASNTVDAEVLSSLPTYLDQPAGLAVPLDMSHVYRYEQLVLQLPQVNNINAPMYMMEFLKAKELTSTFYCKLLLDYERAKNKTKEENALAYLERSQDYIKNRGLKDTDETKKQYVQIDPRYKQAKDQEDMLKALVTLIGNKVDKFQAAHDDTKKIYDQTRDPRGYGASLPSKRDEQ